MSKIYEDKERAKSLQADQRKSSPFVDLFCRNLRKACACLGAFGRSPKVATRLAAFASVADDFSMTSSRLTATSKILYGKRQSLYKRLPLRLDEVLRHIRIHRTENSTFV